MPINIPAVRVAISYVRSSFKTMMAIFSFFLTRVAILLLCIPPMALSNVLTFEKIPLPTGVTGPASFVFDSLGGGPYASVQDGRILKYVAATACFVDFSFNAPNRSKAVCDGQPNDLGATCGRPLGLDFNPVTRQLYAADAYVGLMVVGPDGGLATQLASGVNGVPFRFLNSVALDPLTPCVYFTEFSAVYQLRDITQAVLSGDATGSLLKYDPETKQVTVLLTGLSGATGVVVSADGTFVLVAELIGKRIQKFWIKGPKCNTTETFITFQGRPNKIKRAGLGDFWVAVNVLIKPPTEIGVPTRIKIDPLGNVLETVPLDKEYNNTRISEVQEHLGAYYIGSRNVSFVGVYKISIES